MVGSDIVSTKIAVCKYNLVSSECTISMNVSNRRKAVSEVQNSDIRKSLL